MKTQSLFGDEDEGAKHPKVKKRPGEARLRYAERSQVTLTPFDLDSLVADDHPVRQVLAFVERLDLSALLDRIGSREHGPGRSATDPRILIALWIYATYRRVFSSHELARLCREHNAFRWLAGGLNMDQHVLSDFRSKNADAFDEVLVELLATLMEAGVLRMKRVAQDGVKIRASAGQSSFRREPSLKKCLKAAKRRLAAAKKRRSDPKKDQRKAAARERGAREREERVARAVAKLPDVRKANSKRKKDPEEARVSTTDPDARIMRMGDGGFRPAYNIQLATDTASRLVVGVSANNVGTDRGQLLPMLDDIRRRTGEQPKELLVDGGFVNYEHMDEAAARGVKVFAPVGKPGPQDEDVDPHTPRPEDSDATRAWRRRMKSEKAKETYKERGATAETVNADLKANRGLDRVTVRGIGRVTSVFLLAVLSYNAMRIIALGALAALT